MNKKDFLEFIEEHEIELTDFTSKYIGRLDDDEIVNMNKVSKDDIGKLSDACSTHFSGKRTDRDLVERLVKSTIGNKYIERKISPYH